MLTIAQPEVMPGTRFVQGMDEEEYHAHPFLSSTGMKNLLRSPKYFRAQRSLNKAKPQFDVGHAIHARVLGVGMPVVMIPDELLSGEHRSVSSAAAKKWVEDARTDGKVPLKPATFAEVVRVSDAVLKHPKAGPLLERSGFTEPSLFAQDPVTGAGLRCRFDRLAVDDSSPVGLDPLDLKSIADISRVERAIIDLRYDVQAFAYRYVLSLLLGVDVSDVPPMTFIFAEKEPPLDVQVVRLADPVWAVSGETDMRRAVDLFAWCTEQGVWPGTDEDGPVRDLPAPTWWAARYMDNGLRPEGTAF